MNARQLLSTFGGLGLLLGGCGAASPSGRTQERDAGRQACRTTSECTDDRNDCKVSEPLRPLCAGQCDVAASAFGCHADADCTSSGPTAICGLLCVCGNDGLLHVPHCIPGCGVDSDCNPGESCNAARHCVSKLCRAQSDCPPDQACRTPPSGTCGPRSCNADGDCEGYCVNGFCSGSLGECLDAVTQEPAPAGTAKP